MTNEEAISLLNITRLQEREYFKEAIDNKISDIMKSQKVALDKVMKAKIKQTEEKVKVETEVPKVEAKPAPVEIFVFGSNLAGRHGKGAAKVAYQEHGAQYGKNYGRHGNSFAIPTKDDHFRPIQMSTVAIYVNDFISYAMTTPQLRFKVTAIGTGLAAQSHEKMAKLFEKAPANCVFDKRWEPFLPGRNYFEYKDE